VRQTLGALVDTCFNTTCFIMFDQARELATTNAMYVEKKLSTDLMAMKYVVCA